MAHLFVKILRNRGGAAGRYMFNLDGYNQYGLYYDDLIGGFDDSIRPDVAEATRRLCIDQPDLYDLKVYRALRANQLYLQKKKLPEEEWTTFEEDETKGRYLQPYLKQIYKEEREKAREIALENS